MKTGGEERATCMGTMQVELEKGSIQDMKLGLGSQ